MAYVGLVGLETHSLGVRQIHIRTVTGAFDDFHFHPLRIHSQHAPIHKLYDHYSIWKGFEIAHFCYSLLIYQRLFIVEHEGFSPPLFRLLDAGDFFILLLVRYKQF